MFKSCKPDFCEGKRCEGSFVLSRPVKYVLVVPVETSQHRDIAFCLALLPYTERCIRKISEASIMKTYIHLLADDVIYDRFKVIISKAKKVASKQEVKVRKVFEEHFLLVCGSETWSFECKAPVRL